MGIKPLDKCRKGDIEESSVKNSKFEVLVERSSTNDNLTITLWKNVDEKFQIGLCNDKENTVRDRWKDILVDYKNYEKDDLPWALYESCCDVYGCLPYPKK